MGDASIKAKPAAAALPAKPPRKSAKSVVIGGVLFVAAASGAGAWLFQQKDRGTDQVRAAGANSAPKYIAHLEGFTVNLADPEESHFLRVTLDLGLDRLPPGADPEKASQVLPVGRVRDAILSVLAVCKADELLKPEGKAQLKKNLVETLNRNVPEIGVRDIYFTEFLVQR